MGYGSDATPRFETQAGPPPGAETLFALQHRLEELEQTMGRLENLAKDQSFTLAQIQIDRSSDRTNTWALLFVGAALVAGCIFHSPITNWLFSH